MIAEAPSLYEKQGFQQTPKCPEQSFTFIMPRSICSSINFIAFSHLNKQLFKWDLIIQNR